MVDGNGVCRMRYPIAVGYDGKGVRYDADVIGHNCDRVGHDCDRVGYDGDRVMNNGYGIEYDADHSRV